MSKVRKLKFEDNKFVSCNEELMTDNEGYKGVWCTNEKNGKYFLRVGENVLQARERAEKNTLGQTNVQIKNMSIQEKMSKVKIDFNKDNIFPELNEEDLIKIGVKVNKPVLLKKNIIDRNAIRHSDLSPKDCELIISQALYSKNKTIIPGKYKDKPNYYNFTKEVRISKKDGSDIYGVVLLDVDNKKDNFEIVHWLFISNKGIKNI